MKAWKFWQSKCYAIKRNNSSSETEDDDNNGSIPCVIGVLSPTSDASATAATAKDNNLKKDRRTSSKFYFDVEALDALDLETHTRISDEHLNGDTVTGQELTEDTNINQFDTLPANGHHPNELANMKGSKPTKHPLVISPAPPKFGTGSTCVPVLPACPVSPPASKLAVPAGSPPATAIKPAVSPKPPKLLNLAVHSPSTSPTKLSPGVSLQSPKLALSQKLSSSPKLSSSSRSSSRRSRSSSGSPVIGRKQIGVIVLCTRGSMYPRSPSSCPPSPLAPHQNQSQKLVPDVGGQKGPATSGSKPSVASKPVMRTAPGMDSSPSSSPGVALKPPLVSTATARNRNSCRRSFTTDDIDLGVSQRHLHLPSRPPPVAMKPRASVLKRLEGTEIGRFQNLDERTQSLETVVEQKKPLPPPKPKPSNASSDFSTGSNTDISSTAPPGKPMPPVVLKTVSATAPLATVASRVQKVDSDSHPSGKNSGKSNSGDSCVTNDSGTVVDVQSDFSSFDSDEGDLSHDLTRSPASPVTMDEVDTEPLDKARRVALEVLTTERAYVDTLHLIDQCFHTELIHRNREERFMPEDAIPQMFLNIKSIYQLHHDFLLPQLEQCWTNWDSGGQRVGFVLKRFAPFLKLYTEYIKNFDKATTVISFWMTKSTKFSAFLDEVQHRPECGLLTLQHHLLSPIQRVPRYELLLKEYLKHLEEDAADRTVAEEALSLVTTSALHANKEMKKIENFRKMLEINESLVGVLELKPDRELVKEGRIIKVSARDGGHQERYLFLFNDILLLCLCLPPIPGMRQQFKIKAHLDVAGMKVRDGNNYKNENTFHIESKQKSIEVFLSSSDEKTEWQRCLWQVISAYTKKYKVHDQFSEEELGKRAPTWVKDQETIMCMICSQRFTLYRRRHHCRACGRVVCGDCSAHKAELVYDNNRENRVCDRCYRVLRQSDKVVDSSEVEVVDKDLASRIHVRSILKVKGSDTALISGYLSVSTDRKNWKKTWIIARKDFALYFFKAHQDVVAFKTLPIPGYQVSAAEGEFVFKIVQSGRTIYFQADNAESMDRWINKLQYMVRLEIPPLDPVEDNSTDPTADAALDENPVVSDADARPLSPATPGIELTSNGSFDDDIYENVEFPAS